MADNPQPGNDPDPGADLNQVKEYQKLVLEYEALDEQIDGLLAQHRGATEHMSDADYEQYRQLARQRDDIYNRMKALEREISLDDEANND